MKYSLSSVLRSYGLPLETIHSDFKSGLEGLLKERPTKAIFIGTRIGDPNAVIFLFPCLVALQISIDLLCPILTPIDLSLIDVPRLPINLLLTTVWDYRLVKSSSRLVHLAGLLS